MLINVSRGALVEESALVDSILSGRIAGAGLDVFSQEPLTLTGHPLSALFGLPNVFLTPHLTFYTHEAMERLERETLQRCDEILGGGPVLVKSRDPRLRSQSERGRLRIAVYVFIGRDDPHRQSFRAEIIARLFL
jgi:D-3-phosphoglycerate dehydrogenase